jgi:hypothetical protein
MLALYWVVKPNEMKEIIGDLYAENGSFQATKMEEKPKIDFFNLLMQLQIISEGNYIIKYQKIIDKIQENKQAYVYNWLEVGERINFDQFLIDYFYDESKEVKKIIISGKEYRRDEIKTPNFFHSLLNGKNSLLIHVYYTQAGENNQNIEGAHSVVVMKVNGGQGVIFFDPNFGFYMFESDDLEKLDEFIMKHFKEACKYIDYTLQVMVVDLVKK